MSRVAGVVAALVFEAALGAGAGACLTACRARSATAPMPAVSAGAGQPGGNGSDGGLHHSLRLAWTGWVGKKVVACGRRAEDLATQGRLGKCLSVEEGAAATASAFTPELKLDTSPVDAGPGACHVRCDDVSGSPGGPAARAWLVSPTGAATPLVEWAPRREDNGDQFAVETSLSPDGKWLAILHLAVGVGEGESSIDVLGLEVRPAPPCR